jgi:epoxide hydrolase-like predicted phosphatase
VLKAVLFDLGGVVLDSPLHAIARFEVDRGLPDGFVNRVVVDTGEAGAWSRLERGMLDVEAFFEPFERDCAEAGQTLSARELFGYIAGGSGPRPVMLEAIRRIRERGLLTAALTNNWTSREQEEAGQDPANRQLTPHFDAFIESSVVGLQKPDPRIYHYACEQVGVEPTEAAFLDDIGRNLKAARQLGMATIKVDEPVQALTELQTLLGFPLLEN